MKAIPLHPKSPLRCEGEVLVAEWPRIGTYRSDRSPRFVAYSDSDPAHIRKFERGGVQAIERRLAGEVSFHASAVELAGRGIVLVAPAGFGKSTHAAALCRFSGAALLADDVAFVGFADGSVTLDPSESEHWLDRHASALVGDPWTVEPGKKMPKAAPAGAGRVPLALVLVLEENPLGAGRVRRLRGVAVLEQLARALLHLPQEMETRVARCRDVDLIAAIARQSVVVAWSPPYEASDGGLPAFVELVSSLLEGESC